MESEKEPEMIFGMKRETFEFILLMIFIVPFFMIGAWVVYLNFKSGWFFK